MKILLIDNYDSFTYNLRQMLVQAGATVTVWRNDRFQLADAAHFDKIVLSPGPGIPDEAGLLKDVIRTYAATKPMLGVCLGHQAIAEVFGARLENLKTFFTACKPLFVALPMTICLKKCPQILQSDAIIPGSSATLNCLPICLSRL